MTAKRKKMKDHPACSPLMTKRAAKIASPVGRSVKEWVGRQPDSMPPPHIRARIFQRGGGKCCLTGREIRPGDEWEAHHVIGLLEGGENRESNLAPALVEPHKIETARQRKLKQKIDRTREKHLGIKDPPARPIQSRGFPPTGKPKLDKLPLPSRRPGYIGCFKIEE